MKFILKYWAQITGLLTLFGFLLIWCWRLAGKFDTLVTQLGDAQQQVHVNTQLLQRYDSMLDNHEKDLVVLKKLEELREKGLLK